MGSAVLQVPENEPGALAKENEWEDDSDKDVHVQLVWHLFPVGLYLFQLVQQVCVGGLSISTWCSRFLHIQAAKQVYAAGLYMSS